MKRVAVVIATKYGQTAKIAQQIASEFKAAGWDAGNWQIEDLVEPSPKEFDAIVLGGPVYMGKFAPELIKWVQRNVATLNAMDSAFFSVSLNAGDKRPQARVDDVRLLSEFLDQTGLIPDWVASIAGKLNYTKYNFLTRWIMKRITKKAGGPTDTSRDHEMTDWAQVAAFAKAIATVDHTSEFAADRQLRRVQPSSLALAGR